MAYYNKMTKAEKTAKLGKLQQARRKMENTKPTKTILEAWALYKILPYKEQLIIRAEWDKYYEEANNSTAGWMFNEQHKALQAKNLVRFRELALEAAEMRKKGDNITIPMPKSFNPYEFDHGSVVHAYKSIDRAIKELTDYPIDEATAMEEAENNASFL